MQQITLSVLIFELIKNILVFCKGGLLYLENEFSFANEPISFVASNIYIFFYYKVNIISFFLIF